MLKRITVLRYHSIEYEDSVRLWEDERFYNVAPDVFRDQMRYLKDNGFTAISLDDLLSIENEEKLPEKPVLLTFDDGHISHYDTALPELKKRGFKGVFFLVVNDIAKDNRLTWEHAARLKDAGMEIGSHGVNHVGMKNYSYQNLIIELKASKLELEERLGAHIKAFAIPRGLYSAKISNVARGMGYKLVFTSFAGNITLLSNPYCLRRMGIRSTYGMDEFKAIVEKKARFILKRRIAQFFKDHIKVIIGLTLYDRIKRLFLKRKNEKETKCTLGGSTV